jgi:hypothetical protein
MARQVIRQGKGGTYEKCFGVLATVMIMSVLILQPVVYAAEEVKIGAIFALSGSVPHWPAPEAGARPRRERVEPGGRD